ncbi:Lrp/AsnC family transcriptional regulator [Candidatus Thorarchaeota archaeon]|nr:MAG: Lrp/AsnC family transcriptional regulator [Candidatus Thorarchaeota archaeon]
MTEKHSPHLDDDDKEILQLIQSDAKMSMKEISEQVGKGISTVHSRIKQMEADGAIRGYTALVNPDAVNRAVLGFILITVRYRAPGEKRVLSQRQFCQDIAKHPFVMGVHVLSGEYDVILKVRTSSIREMNGFIVDFLREIPAVDKTLTMFVMDTYKDSLRIEQIR